MIKIFSIFSKTDSFPQCHTSPNIYWISLPQPRTLTDTNLRD
jgi:hypothetical protein